MSWVPIGAVELRGVTVDGEGLGYGLALADAMSDVLGQAVAQGGSFVFVDDVSTRFEQRITMRTTGSGSREVAVTHVHARVFRVPGKTP
jgi:hypothetical protein